MLSWYENLPSEEVPPEHLWEDAEGLELWWDRVKAMRDSGLPVRGAYSSDEDEGESGLAENDLARVLKQD